ncbi:sugar ABC transporter ATP-binding protein (plasmid) [Deinococcus aetherius]|uniref:Sugar ABC transporter ATP-binding protein n=1 Tax=Deinococcus aetherius TaxID=200252 RepID=A0ABM8AKC4_9DEIO|nr:ABC transporter ATP-binding protein [Deinococcus aetherius]BDP44278.1 sugar ABC transporter ATP-binding protein [Deinococcus aetherius]
MAPRTRPADAAGPPVLRLRGITKRFPGVTANDHVSLEVHAGEVLGLLGENGAGKSTLVSILYGLYRPDEGDILMDGREVRLTSPAQALRLGIGLVPQHPLLVERHTVAENLALGAGGAWLPVRRVTPRLRELSRAYGLEVDPNAPVHTLSPGEKQRVEILRALLGGARVLILDEPTSVLTPQEAEGLFRVMRELRASGKSLIFISHKLGEVLDICDRTVVLRRGRVVGGLPIAEATQAKLAELMVGRGVNFERRRVTGRLGPVLLGVRDLQGRGERGHLALRVVSFDLHAGEVLGVAGVAGNGQTELVEVLAGLRPTSGGEITLGGQPLTGDPARRFSQGVAHIPEDRLHTGTVPTMSVSENLVLREHGQAPFSRGGLRDIAAQDDFARRMVDRYGVSTPGIHTPSRLLSGGNIQKLILARELAENAQLILAVHPTYGLDIGATEQVHGELLRRAEGGAGVLLVGEDLDELLLLCDRIAVMVHGELLGPFDAARTSREELGLRMTGGAA